jgi:hypothetical protein
MALANQICQLSEKQLMEVYGVMLEAGITNEFCGNYREIFRRAKHRRVGRMRRIYETLEQAAPDDIKAVSQALTENLK